jgi:hypothetical protein
MYTDEVYYGYGVDKHPRLKKTYAQFRARLTIMSGWKEEECLNHYKNALEGGRRGRGGRLI